MTTQYVPHPPAAVTSNPEWVIQPRRLHCFLQEIAHLMRDAKEDAISDSFIASLKLPRVVCGIAKKKESSIASLSTTAVDTKKEDITTEERWAKDPLHDFDSEDADPEFEPGPTLHHELQQNGINELIRDKAQLLSFAFAVLKFLQSEPSTESFAGSYFHYLMKGTSIELSDS